MSKAAKTAFRLVADERERASGIPGILSGCGVKVDFAMLDVGDYILSPETGVERKTLRDLLSSIYDGRLFDQCSELASSYRRPLLMVEGNLADLPMMVQNVRAVYGALTSVTVKEGVHILYTLSPEDTADVLLSLCGHLAEERGRGPLLRKPRKSEEIGLQQLYVVASLPGVGERLALRLLDAFSTPRAILSARAVELARVPGIGRARALKIEKALTTRYKLATGRPARQAKLPHPAE